MKSGGNRFFPVMKEPMKTSIRIASAALTFLAANAALAQRPYHLLPGVHPGYSLVSMRPSGMASSGGNAAPNVGGMAWLRDGKLFIASMSSNNAGGVNASRLGVSHGYIFSGIPGATSNATVTVEQVSTGYQMPSGAVVVGDSIYVLDNEEGLTKLVPNGGTYTKTTLHKGALGRTPGALSDTANRTWTGGLTYKDGFFYAAVGNALMPGGTAFGFTGTQEQRLMRGKGVIYKISLDGAVVDTFAAGVRNPVAMNWGPDGTLLYTDNQGSFMPASAIFPVTEGAFYGHLKSPFDTRKRTPPAIIFPYGSNQGGGDSNNPAVARVATDMLTLREGRFKDHMLVGVNHTTGLLRVFMEKVPDGNGGYVYQGAVFPFSQGFGVGTGTGALNVPSQAIPGVLPDFRSNVNRLSYGPDGHIYVGGGNSPGANSGGSHGFEGGQQYGLARLVPNNDTVFEIKAIRSLGSTQMEVEFTEPVSAATAANFRVRQWGNLQASTTAYGSGYYLNAANLTVTGVELDATKTKAVLTITGLQERPAVTTAGSEQDRRWGYVVQIRVKDVAAVSGRPMWSDTSAAKRELVGWYTLNKFGPGEAVATGVKARGDVGEARTGMKFTLRPEGVLLRSPVDGAYAVRTLDMRGKVIATHEVAAGVREYLVPASSLARGVTLIEARAADGRRFTASASRL